MRDVSKDAAQQRFFLLPSCRRPASAARFPNDRRPLSARAGRRNLTLPFRIETARSGAGGNKQNS